MKLSKQAKNAILIASMCSFAYLAVYISRNMLGSITPAMIEAGFTEEYLGKISSFYLVFYAVGQLINGALGDRIKAKWMVCVGLAGAGLMTFVFMSSVTTPLAAMISYGCAGFFLSMIYGPMTKMISENTELIYATRCSLGYTFASFLGSPSAGILAATFVWQNALGVSSAALIAMSLLCFVYFSFLERKKIVTYSQLKKRKSSDNTASFKVLFKRGIIKFSLISIITGVVRTSVVFWLPTYINQYLGFSTKDSTLIYSVATFVISFTAFINIFIYEKMGRNMNKNLVVMFVSSAIFFTLTFFVKIPYVNIVLIVLAIMSSNGAASTLWSIYCPSLSDTGMVSSATGYLDFLSYTAAAAANIIFANSVTTIGWSNLILVWLGIILCGVFLCLPYKKKQENVQ
jgi:sugar phosphate permease